MLFFTTWKENETGFFVMHGEKRGRIPYSRLKCLQVPPMFRGDLHSVDDVLARLRLSRLHLWSETIP